MNARIIVRAVPVIPIDSVEVLGVLHLSFWIIVLNMYGFSLDMPLHRETSTDTVP